MATVLVLVTQADTLGLLDGEQHRSGFWAEEWVVPYERIRAAGYTVEVATSGGRPPSVDPGSLDPTVVERTRPTGKAGDPERDVAHYRAVLDSAEELHNPRDAAAVCGDDPDRYAGVFICGGHGAMDDLPHDRAMTRLVGRALATDRPLASVCHGQSALLPLRDGAGHWPLLGRRMTAFSHEEELVTALAHRLPFVLQLELERLGASYGKAAQTWGSCVISDDNLITGQNPHSTAALTDTFLHRLASA